MHEELPYWIATASGGVGSVPLDLPGGENVAASTATVTVQLNEENTRALIQEMPKAYQTQVNDALLTALAQVLASWTGKNTVRFDLEGHGREPLFDDIDLTRTVGWFTTIFPVQLDVNTSDPGGALKAVKEQLRQVPNRGLTYGLLRYLTTDSQMNGRLSALPAPDVAFNYLGQLRLVRRTPVRRTPQPKVLRTPHRLRSRDPIPSARASSASSGLLRIVPLGHTTSGRSIGFGAYFSTRSAASRSIAGSST